MAEAITLINHFKIKFKLTIYYCYIICMFKFSSKIIFKSNSTSISMILLNASRTIPYPSFIIDYGSGILEYVRTIQILNLNSHESAFSTIYPNTESSPGVSGYNLFVKLTT